MQKNTDFNGRGVTSTCFCPSTRLYLGEFYTHVILGFSTLVDGIAFLIHYNLIFNVRLLLRIFIMLNDKQTVSDVQE